MGEQSLALVERRQPEWRHLGLEELDRVRIEGGDDHRPALVKCARDRAADHRLVAEMESVEIAEGDDAPLELIGDAAGEGEPLHSCRSIGQFSGSEGDCRNSRYSWTASTITKQVEDAEQDQADLMGEAVAVELVGDEAP